MLQTALLLSYDMGAPHAFLLALRLSCVDLVCWWWRWQAEDPDLPAFYFDPVINPISAFRSARPTVDEEDDEASWDVSRRHGQ